MRVMHKESSYGVLKLVHNHEADCASQHRIGANLSNALHDHNHTSSFELPCFSDGQEGHT